MIPITKPFMPPAEEYEAYIKKIWDSEWLTNNGPLVQELENELKSNLGVKHLLYLGNGTVALQFAIKSLGLEGDILTTPFSYVATTSSIVWEGCSPVFVDIDPETLNMDPDLIEDSITANTTAILATHVFGNPCDIESIMRIAAKHRLKVIFDASHCFGSEYRGKSVYEFGDISTASFHATKLYQTVEGGAIITKDPEIARRVDYMRNFGHDGPLNYDGVGINGKNSEFHAAMGLVNLKYINSVLASRKNQFLLYDTLLEGLNAKTPFVVSAAKPNHSYYPLIFHDEATLVKTQNELRKAQIFTRRYFYPGLNKLAYVKRQETPVCDEVSPRILCLPLYFTLKKQEQERIARIVLQSQQI